eukprot:7954729-Karenia_brevis.AAC.1
MSISSHSSTQNVHLTAHMNLSFRCHHHDLKLIFRPSSSLHNHLAVHYQHHLLGVLIPIVIMRDAVLISIITRLGWSSPSTHEHPIYILTLAYSGHHLVVVTHISPDM